MTSYRRSQFTADDAGDLLGRYADITGHLDDGITDETITYPGAWVSAYSTGSPGYLSVIKADREPLNIFFSGICEVADVRDVKGP